MAVLAARTLLGTAAGPDLQMENEMIEAELHIAACVFNMRLPIT